jgi:hypothetical protein
LDNNEKETLDEDISLEEISNASFCISSRSPLLCNKVKTPPLYYDGLSIFEFKNLYIVNKLDNNEKETLDEDISLEEISNVIKILKPNKSPGEDGIISEFYQLYWQDIKMLANLSNFQQEIYQVLLSLLYLRKSDCMCNFISRIVIDRSKYRQFRMFWCNICKNLSKNMVLADYIGIFFTFPNTFDRCQTVCTNKNRSYKHNEQINKQNIDNSECFGVKFVKIYPEITSQ